MGGGKSRWLCEETKELLMAYPGNRGVICRYHLSDFKNTTLKTFLECCSPQLIASHNQSDHVIKMVNGSELLYLGLAEEESVNKIKSMELGFFAIDEASETAKNHFLLFQSRLRRRLTNGTHPPFYGLLSTNPEDCWLKDMFVLGHGGGDYLFVPSLPRDNPYLPGDYEDQLRKSYPEDWIKRYLEGSWDDLTGGDIVIPSDWIRQCINREIEQEDKRLVAADIARFGDDEIVIYYGKGRTLLEQDISSKKSLMETVGRLLAITRKHHAQAIVVDDIGVGGGVTDRLREMKQKVIPINVGHKTENERFSNLKAEMWWYAREMFRDGKVSILNEPVLIRQLSAVKYLYRSNGKIMVEPKSDTKTRIAQSPDRADAFILYLWGLRFLKDLARDFTRRPDSAEFLKDRSNDYGWNYNSTFPVGVPNYGE